ncbi:unnamed protein product, partial [Musa textilis]
TSTPDSSSLEATGFSLVVFLPTGEDKSLTVLSPFDGLRR